MSRVEIDSEVRNEEFSCRIYYEPPIDRVGFLFTSYIDGLTKFESSVKIHTAAPAAVEGESAMPDLRNAFAIALGVLLTAAPVLLASAQSSDRVLAPHHRGGKTPEVHLGHSNTVSAQSTMPPLWTRLSNAPPVSVGAMLLLTDGRVLAHEEPNCGGTNCAGMDFSAWYVLTPDIN